MPIDIPLWKTNTGQKRSLFFGPKISSKINPGGCNRIATYSHLVRNQTFKKFLEIQATRGCRFTLKQARDMMRTYIQINPSNKYVKQRLLSCIL